MSAIGKWFGKKAGKAVLLTAAAGAILAGTLVAGGAVFANSGTPKGPAAGPGENDRPHLLAGAYHGDGTWLVVDGTTRTTSSDVGTITSAAEGSVTIALLDGRSVSTPVTDAACIRQDGRPATLSDLRAGERALVVQANGTALMIRAGEPSREPGSGCRLLEGVVHGDITVRFLDGSTKSISYDAGLVTGVTESDISFVRFDGETVTLTYDSTTFVLEEGQPGSVGDLGRGDRAMFFSEDGHAEVIRCIRGRGA